MAKRTSIPASIVFGTALWFAASAHAQIASIAATTGSSGRRLFINADPVIPTRLVVSRRPRTTIYLSPESSFLGRSRPAVTIDRDGADTLVREAAERHHVDPALVRAVIETESNWNPGAYSRKGAAGLMQLIPTTAQRFGVNDIFNPQQNIDGGVRYLKSLLERYNGNLDMAIAAYNAGEGAVDRAHGIPAYRETQEYVQRVQNAYFRPGSGRLSDAWIRARSIHRDVHSDGRIIFSND